MSEAIVNCKTNEYFKIENGNFSRVLTYPEYSIFRHTHEFVEINIVKSGSGYHTLSSNRIKVKAGDVFVIPSGVVHSYENEDSLCVYHIIVCDEFMSKYREELFSTPGYSVFFDIEPSFRSNTPNGWFLNVDAVTLRYIEGEIEKAAQAYSGSNYILNNVITLNLICFLCCEMHKYMTRKSKTLPVSDMSLIRSLQFIEKNISQKITVDELSKMSNMSVSTFNRHFRSSLGVTPAIYIIQKRVATAKKLISESSRTKTEIAQMCGFYDASHMEKYL